MWGYGYRPYVPVAKRRANALVELNKLSQKKPTHPPTHRQPTWVARALDHHITPTARATQGPHHVRGT